MRNCVIAGSTECSQGVAALMCTCVTWRRRRVVVAACSAAALAPQIHQIFALRATTVFSVPGPTLDSKTKEYRATEAQVACWLLLSAVTVLCDILTDQVDWTCPLSTREVVTLTP